MLVLWVEGYQDQDLLYLHSVRTLQTAENVSLAIDSIYKNTNIPYHIYTSKINEEWSQNIK